MAYTKLTKTTTAPLIKELGDSWDNNFTGDVKAYWTGFWRSTRRLKCLVKIEESLSVLVKARDGKTSCDFSRLAEGIQTSAYRLRELRPENLPFTKSKGAKSGKDELLALLGAPFVDGLYYAPGSLALQVITPPIEIRRDNIVYPMGQYRIELNLNGIPNRSTTMNILPHRTRDRGGSHHVHVNTNGNVCRGEASGPMAKLFTSGLLYEAVAFLFAFLQSPSAGGYTDLGYFTPGGSASARPICGWCHFKPDDSKALQYCKYCRIALCKACTHGELCIFCNKKRPKQKTARKVKTKTKAETRIKIKPPNTRRQRIVFDPPG